LPWLPAAVGVVETTAPTEHLLRRREVEVPQTVLAVPGELKAVTAEMVLPSPAQMAEAEAAGLLPLEQMGPHQMALRLREETEEKALQLAELCTVPVEAAVPTLMTGEALQLRAPEELTLETAGKPTYQTFE